jgi:hypothetical protein
MSKQTSKMELETTKEPTGLSKKIIKFIYCNILLRGPNQNQKAINQKIINQIDRFHNV